MTTNISSFPIKGKKIIELNDGVRSPDDYVPAQKPSGEVYRLPVSVPYVLSGFTGDNGVLFSASQKIGVHSITDDSTLPAGIANSSFKALYAAAASAIITIKKNGTSIGTATFAIGGTVATIVFSASVTLTGGIDEVEIIAPSSPDATLSGVYWSIRAIR